MNSDLLEKWRTAEEARRAYADSFEAWLEGQADAAPIVKPDPLIMPPGVIKQFSGADGVAAWDGARNMTTPLRPHSFVDVPDHPLVGAGGPGLKMSSDHAACEPATNGTG